MEECSLVDPVQLFHFYWKSLKLTIGIVWFCKVMLNVLRNVREDYKCSTLPAVL
jgi:hypothetical protein